MNYLVFSMKMKVTPSKKPFQGRVIYKHARISKTVKNGPKTAGKP